MDMKTFFLGGYDLEMVTIRDLLHAEGQSVVDHQLGWGARLSHYRAEMEAAFAAGDTLIGVELTDDLPPEWPPRAALTLVDHHGERAGEPCALRQVFALLGLPEARWTRQFTLIAANDTGHVKAMAAMGASRAEMAAIRAGDRAAQGITPEEEAAGRIALAQAQIITPAPGAAPLRVVRLPHARTATVTDPLALEPGEGAEGSFTSPHSWRGGSIGRLKSARSSNGLWGGGHNAGNKEMDLLILSPDSTHFFGSGSRIAALDAAFPGGWRGGELPTRGFWGVARVLAEGEVASRLILHVS